MQRDGSSVYIMAIMMPKCAADIVQQNLYSAAKSDNSKISDLFCAVVLTEDEGMCKTEPLKSTNESGNLAMVVRHSISSSA